MRPGPGRARAEVRKRYVLVARTKMLTYYLLGDWSMATFAVVLPDVSGFVCTTGTKTTTPSRACSNGISYGYLSRAECLPWFGKGIAVGAAPRPFEDHEPDSMRRNICPLPVDLSH
jgi:hypothetical protein